MGNIFSAYDIRGRIGESLTTDYVWNVGKAFAEWLPDEGPVVLATRDDTNKSIAHAFTEGLLLQGRDVIDTGTENQQGLIAILRDGQAAGGVIVTHDALQGIEVITLLDSGGVGITAELGLTEIDQLVESGNFVPASQKGELRTGV